MKSFRDYYFWKWGQSPRCCEDGGPRPVQGTIPAAQSATIHMPPSMRRQSRLLELQREPRHKAEPGMCKIMCLVTPSFCCCLGEPTEERAQTSKDLKHKEIWHTKTGKENGSNIMADATGFFWQPVPISLWQWKTLTCCQQPQLKSKHADPGHPSSPGKSAGAQGQPRRPPQAPTQKPFPVFTTRHVHCAKLVSLPRLWFLLVVINLS